MVWGTIFADIGGILLGVISSYVYIDIRDDYRHGYKGYEDDSPIRSMTTTTTMMMPQLSSYDDELGSSVMYLLSWMVTLVRVTALATVTSDIEALGWHELSEWVSEWVSEWSNGQMKKKENGEGQRTWLKDATFSNILILIVTHECSHPSTPDWTFNWKYLIQTIVTMEAEWQLEVCSIISTTTSNQSLSTRVNHPSTKQEQLLQ